jgi:ferredoxin
MQASVDSTRCSGHARCNAVAPQVYTLDDSGYCDIGKDLAVPPELEAAARDGAANCPERAITLAD